MNLKTGWIKTAGLIAALALIMILAPAALADSYSDGLVTWTYSGGSITGAALASGVTSVGTLAIPEYVPSGSSYVPVTSVGGFSGIGTASVDTVIIPKHVTSIADKAFMNCSNIKSYDFQCSGLKTIGGSAFMNNSALTEIDLPDSVTSIGPWAFNFDSALTSIDLPASLTSIGAYAFYQNSALESIDLPDSLTSIGSYAFYEDSALTGGIVIPAGVTTLDSYTFKKCSSLTSVQLPDGLTSIGTGCFSSCTSLADINFPSGLKTIGGNAFSGSVITSIDLPDTISNLYNYAFSSCSKLTEATVRSGLLGNGVFSSCTELQRVTLGDGVSSLANAVFTNDISLTDLSVSANNPYFCSEGNILFNKGKTILSQFSPAISGAVTLPDSLTAIKDFSLDYCPYLTSITLPESLTSVGAVGFGYCASLTRIVFKGVCPTFSSDCYTNHSGSLITYYPVKYESSWSSFSLSSKQAYAFVTWELSDSSEAATTMENVNSGLIAAPADPVRDGYTFAGWYDGASDTAAKWDFAVNTVTDDLTLYAHWTAIPYTITFDSKGGSAIDPITADCGATLTAPADPSWEGYTFLGWDVAFPSTMPAGGAVLTAKWVVSVCTVTFDPKDGSAITSITVDYGAKITKPDDLVRDGYYFGGWFVDGVSYWDFENSVVTSDLEFDAFWTGYMYSVLFDSNGGSAVAPIQAECGTALTVPADPTREGYTFICWLPEFPATMPAYGAELTAQWKANQYTITFDSSGGSAVDPITADCDSALTAPADPTREGYTFAGWAPAFPATMPANGATLMAKWTVNQYTITFDSNGGSAVDSITADYGSELTKPADPTWEGYTFAGWSPAFPAKMPLNGAALTAQWTANLYAYSVVYYYNGTKDDSKTVSDTAAFGSSISTYPDKSIAGYALDHDTLPLTITVNPAANVLSVYYVKDSVQLVEKITLTTENGFTVVYKGETVQLNAGITPADADDQSLTWKSSNTKYATVSAQGIVTGKSAGKVKITAAAQDGSGVSGSINLTVAAPETSIKLSASSAVLYHNAEADALKTLQLTASASPKGTTYRGLTWSVFSGDAATVDASTGLVTAVKEGTAVIRATTDKGHSADCTITVRTLPTTFALKTTEKTLAFKQSFDLGAEAVMDGTEPTLTWTTSNKKVATVSSSGVVTARKSVTGKATITATTKNGLKDTCVVTVVKSLPKRTSNAAKITKEAQSAVGLKLSGGDYETSNASVAGVAKNGEVTLNKDGTATLEAGGEEITVKVSGGNPVSLTMCEGAELTLISEDAVKWSAKDDRIAAIDAAGRLTAQREGTTTITGEAQAGGAIEIKVIVKQPAAAQATPEPAQTDEPQPVLSEPEPSAEPAPAVEPSPSEEPELTVEPTPSPEPEPTPKPEKTPAPEPDPDPTPVPETDSGAGT